MRSGPRHNLGCARIPEHTGNGQSVKAWLGFGLLVMLLASASYGQAPPRKQLPSTSALSPLPLPHIYMHFLLYQNHLDQSASLEGAQGRDGSWLRDHFQQTLGFTDSQYAVVRTTGLRLQAELIDLRSRARTIIMTERSSSTRVSADAGSPTRSPEVKELMVEREALIQREIGNLDHELGPAAAEKLRDFLANHFLQTGALSQSLSGRKQILLKPGSKTVQP